ncbi:hypothetical protein CSOJ01_10091 [Colletotrichum sojae]|uniref:Uncharacterized protein n=1 Tax=Colletotrichum sojae TaxID=2175907 RepID=A0A8H6MPM9_9PEZI|nr:hypothetical protein CSOJ01_10091 [Colletotrichum sojae]
MYVSDLSAASLAQARARSSRDARLYFPGRQTGPVELRYEAGSDQPTGREASLDLGWGGYEEEKRHHAILGRCSGWCKFPLLRWIYRQWGALLSAAKRLLLQE